MGNRKLAKKQVRINREKLAKALRLKQDETIIVQLKATIKLLQSRMND